MSKNERKCLEQIEYKYDQLRTNVSLFYLLLLLSLKNAIFCLYVYLFFE